MYELNSTSYIKAQNCSDEEFHHERKLPKMEAFVWMISVLTILANILLITVLVCNRSIGKKVRIISKFLDSCFLTQSMALELIQQKWFTESKYIHSLLGIG